MNLAEYKRQAQELAEILMNFSGKEEEAEEFAKTLMEKYREFGEFNAKALECKKLAEFKNLADANGMKFESDKEANELFLGLSKGKEEVEKAILSAEEMAAVSGGGFDPRNKKKETMLQDGSAQAVAPQRQAQQAVPVVGGRQKSKLGYALMILGIVGTAVGALDGLLRDGAGDVFGVTFTTLSGFVGVCGGLINEYNERTT